MSKKSSRPTKPSKQMPSTFVAVLREKLGLPRKTFARLTGYSERAIAGWESGEPISQPSILRMREVERLHDSLASVIRAEAIPKWLETPNSAFDGLKPVEVVERGQVDKLWRMIFYLESGVAS